MTESNWQDELTGKIRELQIVVGALIAGCAVFMAVVLVVDIEQDPKHPPVLTYVALNFVASALVARMLIRRAMIKSARRKITEGTWKPPGQTTSPQLAEFLERTGDAGKLWMLLNITTIIGAALLEGSAFFALMAFMLEQTWATLILAILLILGLILQMPTRSGVIHWIEDQLALLKRG